MKKLLLLLAICFILPLTTYAQVSQDIKFEEQVVVEKEVGYKLVGEGRIDNASANLKGNYTRHKYTGPEEFGYKIGCRNFQIKDITLVNCGVHITAVRGVGTGHGEFNNVSFLGRGVKFGSPEFNGNAADCVFNRCYFKSCPFAMSTTTSQNINYVFRDCFFVNCPDILQINGGGNVVFENCYIIRCGVLVHVTKGTDGTKLGSQNSQFIFKNTRYDQSQKNNPCILFDESYYGGGRTLDMDYTNFPPFKYAEPHPLVEVARNAKWTINIKNSRNLPDSKKVHPTNQIITYN